ncbi:unnamed protein product [Blepharisma stoltei]|uniref:Tim44-like domain-containing protein n=1 Tax=Blepharisma stoltei TaxID=1481888 RepID=A0AAU9JMH8_9CILI|nr:unnamed protein product [Blepharisma stoltei]
MFGFGQIYVIVILILLIFLQTAESRAGGGGGSSGGSSRSSSRRSRSYSSSYHSSNNNNDNSDEASTLDYCITIGTFLLFAIFAILGYFFSIDKKVEKKHNEITKQLYDESIKESIWDEKDLILNVNQSFIDLQKAWSEQDLNFIEGKLCHNLFIKWRDILNDMRYRNESNVVSNVVVNKIRFVKLDKSEKIFTVFIDAKVKDVTVNLSSGKILKDQSGRFREFWTYIWNIDGWLLMEISQENESSKFL